MRGSWVRAPARSQVQVKMFFGEKFIPIEAIAKYREAPARSQVQVKMFFGEKFIPIEAIAKYREAPARSQKVKHKRLTFFA